MRIATRLSGIERANWRDLRERLGTVWRDRPTVEDLERSGAYASV